MRINVMKVSNPHRHKKLLLAVAIVFIVLLSAAVFLSARILANPRVYSGVYLDGVHLAGLTEDNLKEYLQSTYEMDLASLELSVFHKSYPVNVSFKDLNVHINIQSTMKQVMEAGRKGNFVQRLAEIYRLQKDHAYFTSEVFLDMNAVERMIDDIYDNTYVSAGAPTLLLLEDSVYLQSGALGYAVNRDVLKERILKQVKQLKSGIVIVPVEEILPARVDIDAFYEQIVQEPKDASIELVDGEVRIIPEVIGRTLDKAAFLSSVAELEAKSGKYPFELKLPVEITKPRKTAQLLKESLFRDELAVYQTTFPLKTENDKARAENIRLAVNAIDGTILLPGETFSFNEVVGRRTAEKGYKVANIYSSSGISSSVGGGVCQVSSTLYNVCLMANMKIEERNPHIYTVSYVPLGRDAAVSFGTEDFKFTNNTAWPIKINGKTSGDRVEFSLSGTNEDPELEVVIQPSISKIIPYTTQYVVDQSLAKGKSVVKQSGMNGAVVDTFYTLKKGKTVISSSKLHTTTYNPLPEIIHVGPEK